MLDFHFSEVYEREMDIKERRRRSTEILNELAKTLNVGPYIPDPTTAELIKDCKTSSEIAEVLMKRHKEKKARRSYSEIPVPEGHKTRETSSSGLGKVFTDLGIYIDSEGNVKKRESFKEVENIGVSISSPTSSDDDNNANAAPAYDEEQFITDLMNNLGYSRARAEEYVSDVFNK